MDYTCSITTGLLALIIVKLVIALIAIVYRIFNVNKRTVELAAANLNRFESLRAEITSARLISEPH